MDNLGDDLILSQLLNYVDLLNVSSSARMQILEWRNSPEIAKNMLSDAVISLSDHDKWINSVLSDVDKKVRVVYCHKIPIGIVTLNNIDSKHSHAEWGLYIGSSSYRGKGLGSLMVSEIQRWGFEELCFNRLYTSVLSTNEKAMALYVKKGFIVEGCWREHLFRDGHFVDLYWMAMLRSQWRG